MKSRKIKIFVMLVVLFLFLVPPQSNGVAAPPKKDESLSSQGTAPPSFEDIKNKLISIDFKNADLDDALRLLAQQNNLNFSLIDKVKGKRITFYFSNVPLEEILKSTLGTSGFKYQEEAGLVKISAMEPDRIDTRIFSIKYADPLSLKILISNLLTGQGAINLERETRSLVISDTYQNFNRIIDAISSLDIKTAEPAKTEVSTSGELTTKVFNLQYAEASKVKDILTKMISDTGSIEANENLNSLIIKDTPAALEKIADLVLKLDRETPQVVISAELVEISSGILNEIGVRWLYQSGQNGEVYSFNQRYYTPPLASGTDNYGFSTADLGASFIYGEVTDKFRGIINALVTNNKANLIATPLVTVVNNEKAKIEITEKYPYQQLGGFDINGNPQYSVQFLDVGVILTVTPHIKEGNLVNLELEPDVSYQLGENIGVPIRATRKATTKVNVRDGKTIVIGGLTSNKKIKNVYKVPILGSIPLIGQLFRMNKDSIDKVELMIFVTPRILTSERIEEMARERKTKLEEKK